MDNKYVLDTRENRMIFMNQEESGIYTGTNQDEDEVIIFFQKHKGMEVWTRHAAKPMWYEVIYYDASGYQEGISYKPTAELESKMEKRARKE